MGLPWAGWPTSWWVTGAWLSCCRGSWPATWRHVEEVEVMNLVAFPWQPQSRAFLPGQPTGERWLSASHAPPGRWVRQTMRAVPRTPTPTCACLLGLSFKQPPYLQVVVQTLGLPRGCPWRVVCERDPIHTHTLRWRLEGLEAPWWMDIPVLHQCRTAHGSGRREAARRDTKPARHPARPWDTGSRAWELPPLCRHCGSALAVKKQPV